jgi:hypothetical protein
MDLESPKAAAGRSVLVLGYVALLVGCCLFAAEFLGPKFSQSSSSYVFAFLAAAFLCFAVSGVLTGKIAGKYFSYSRWQSSRSFWFEVSFQALIGLACAFIAVRGMLGLQ